MGYTTTKAYNLYPEGTGTETGRDLSNLRLFVQQLLGN